MTSVCDIQAEAARKSKRAKSRWLNRALSNCFDLWFDDVFVDAAELYLGLSNKDSSIAQQRLREARAARAKYQDLGAILGMSYPAAEVE